MGTSNTTNGTRSSDREKVFAEFHRETGLRPFSPEFIESLVATMRYSRCLSEVIYAWVRWRSWGNSSRYAVSHWDRNKGKALDQIDCAVDVAWFRGGQSVEWVQGAPENVRQSARNAAEKTKGQFSRGFAKVWNTGRIEFESGLIYAIDTAPDPEVVDSRFRVAGTSNYQTDKAFQNWWRVADTSNYETYQSAYIKYIDARRTARAAYTQYRKQQPAEPATGSNGTGNHTATEPAISGLPILYDVKPLGNTSSPAPDPPVETATTTPDLTPIEVAVRALCTPDADACPKLFELCREKAPDCTPEEVAVWVRLKIQAKKGEKLRSPIGYLHTVVPKQFEPEALKAFREERRAGSSPATPSREENLAYLRREWGKIPEKEQAGYLEAFPELFELCEVGKGAGR